MFFLNFSFIIHALVTLFQIHLQSAKICANIYMHLTYDFSHKKVEIRQLQSIKT